MDRKIMGIGIGAVLVLAIASVFGIVAAQANGTDANMHGEGHEGYADRIHGENHEYGELPYTHGENHDRLTEEQKEAMHGVGHEKRSHGENHQAQAE